ncbi:hypothetical protein [Flavobacterium nitratireducens]|uniref:hypothetical protein n=1 Tax=Flavobacterium nitratireducens TaxID=992289 RepID=UPI002415393A|nr:hypothetical protein [Flavobacterium nitratireducens]
MTYIRHNVVKPLGKSPGAAAPKDPNVTIVAVDDILTFPVTDGKGVNYVGNFVMKAGARMYTVYMTPSKIKAGYESDGDEDSITFKQRFEGEHPGHELEIAEFVQNWTGVNVIIIYGSCSDNFRKVIGTKCAPVQLKPSLTDDNDSRKHMLVFEQFAKSGYVIGHYTGALVFADPFAVVSASAIAVNSTNGYIYQLPAEVAAIEFSEITLNHGDVITLIGGGGDTPATLSPGVENKDAILKGFSVWIALEGATLTLEVFKAGSLTFLIEKSRG